MLHSPTNRSEMRRQYSEGGLPVGHGISMGQPIVSDETRTVSFDQKTLPREAFAYMVLHESEPREWSSWRKRIARVISHMYFDACMGLIIVVNAIIIGVEIEYEGDVHMRKVFQILDVFFLSIFLLELAGKLIVFRAKYFTRCVNVGDLTLVILGVIGLVLHIQGSESEMQDDVRKVTVLKLARLLRLIRIVRLSTQFHSLWIIIHGLSGCLTTVMWTSVLLFSVTYFFAVLAIEYISSDLEVQELEFDTGGSTFGDRFENIPSALVSLLTFFAIENVSAVGWKLMSVRPWTFLYLVAWTLVVPIVLLNLITAVIVEISVNAAKKDDLHRQALEFEEWQRVCKIFEELFVRMTHALDRKGSNNRSSRTSQQLSKIMEASRVEGGWRKKIKSVVTSVVNVSNFEDTEEELIDLNKKLTRHRVQELKENEEVREKLNLIFGEAPNSLSGFDRLMELWVLLDTDDDNQISMVEFTEGMGRLHNVIKSHNSDTFVMLRMIQELKKAHDERSEQASLLKDLQKSQRAICEQMRFLTAEVQACRADKTLKGVPSDDADKATAALVVRHSGRDDWDIMSAQDSDSGECDQVEGHAHTEVAGQGDVLRKDIMSL